MNFKDFLKNEGLKKLALTKLKSSSYSILIYLFNEILSGVDQIISSRKELSMLLGWPEREINEGLEELQFFNMIQIIEVPGKPLRIRGQLNLDSWNVSYIQAIENTKKPTIGDTKNLHSLLPTGSHTSNKKIKLIELNIFDSPIPFPKKGSKHKVTKEQKGKQKSNENKLNDLDAFRIKHEEIDSKIKTLAMNELETIRHEKRTITADEELLLQILSQHHQPRKQLILALRSNLIYPNLKFFLANAKMCANIAETKK